MKAAFIQIVFCVFSFHVATGEPSGLRGSVNKTSSASNNKSDVNSNSSAVSSAASGHFPHVGCDVNCWHKGQIHTCRERVEWLRGQGWTLHDSVEQVNDDCNQQCGCVYHDFHNAPNPSPTLGSQCENSNKYQDCGWWVSPNMSAKPRAVATRKTLGGGRKSATFHLRNPIHNRLQMETRARTTWWIAGVGLGVCVHVGGATGPITQKDTVALETRSWCAEDSALVIGCR